MASPNDKRPEEKSNLEVIYKQRDEPSPETVAGEGVNCQGNLGNCYHQLHRDRAGDSGK